MGRGSGAVGGALESQYGSWGFETFGEWARLFVFVPLALFPQRLQSGWGTKDEELKLFSPFLFGLSPPQLFFLAGRCCIIKNELFGYDIIILFTQVAGTLLLPTWKKTITHL